jgi:glycosyltransferase involved in cell wall biosynthesis
MITISVCMIVKDEEDVLERALSSIKDIADEIIIVDTESTDMTKEIAAKFTDKIFDFEWCDDFSKARNYSFSKATQDYCMWLDADDVLLEADQKELMKLKET